MEYALYDVFQQLLVLNVAATLGSCTATFKAATAVNGHISPCSPADCSIGQPFHKCQPQTL